MARFLSPITNIKPNGTVKFFKSGTNTDLITFKDELETIQNTLSVDVTPDGNLPNIFFSGTAKVKYFDEFAVQYAERDPVGGEKELGDFALWDTVVLYDKGDFVEGSDGRFYQSLTNGNVGNDPTTSTSNWKEIPFNGIYNATISYGSGDVAQTTDGNLWKSLAASNLNNNPSTDDGTKWEPAFTNPWINKNSAFTVEAGKMYQIDGSAGAVDGALKTTYVAGDELTVGNESISTNTVRLTNTALTIRGAGDTLNPGDGLILEPGDTAKLVAKTTLILEAR